MRAGDEPEIAAGTPAAVLMDRAGRAVAWAVRRRLGFTYGARVVVVCGKGDNGGDGLVAAAVLRSWGVRVTTFVLDDRADESFDAGSFERALRRADLLVDAMYG